MRNIVRTRLLAPGSLGSACRGMRYASQHTSCDCQNMPPTPNFFFSARVWPHMVLVQVANCSPLVLPALMSLLGRHTTYNLSALSHVSAWRQENQEPRLESIHLRLCLSSTWGDCATVSCATVSWHFLPALSKGWKQETGDGWGEQSRKREKRYGNVPERSPKP